MPKMKTHSGAKKRFKKLKSGLIKAEKAFHRHLLTKKNSKTKRKLRGSLYVNAANMPNVERLLPY